MFHSFATSGFLCPDMDFDDELPPDLVQAGPANNSDDEKIVKVPITIVTGMKAQRVYSSVMSDHS